jgi:triacylglycerol lipase
MDEIGRPVVLVHGWNSHPGIWNRLIARLDEDGIPHWRCDHTGIETEGLPERAAALGEYLGAMRRETGYDGTADIVCHSVGTCIARYFFEVLDGDERRERARQLIGIGPPNNGSALAELFSHREHGPAVINRLTGIFVPQGFDPATDRIVQDVRPKSPVMIALRMAGMRSDIRYRVIVTANPGGDPAFLPFFSGKTYELTDNGNLDLTVQGDGIVSNRESALPGVSLDVLPAETNDNTSLPPPDQYCHLHLPRNPEVIDRVMAYLR